MMNQNMSTMNNDKMMQNMNMGNGMNSMMSSGANSMMNSSMNSMMSSNMNSQMNSMNMNQGMMGMMGQGMNYNIMPKFRRDSSFILNINSPIIVPDHEHPLIFCFVKERQANLKSWICNKCKLEIKNEQMIPSFYCTFCGYDLCQLCVGKYQLNELKVFVYG